MSLSFLAAIEREIYDKEPAANDGYPKFIRCLRCKQDYPFEAVRCLCGIYLHKQVVASV